MFKAGLEVWIKIRVDTDTEQELNRHNTWRSSLEIDTYIFIKANYVSRPFYVEYLVTVDDYKLIRDGLVERFEAQVDDLVSPFITGIKDY